MRVRKKEREREGGKERVTKLVEFCKEQFKFGGGLREQLESVWKQTGIKPKELEELTELPDCFKYAWEYFLKLNQKRTSNGFGLNPISYSEMKSFFELNRIIPDPIEVEVISLLDNIALEHYAKEQEKNNKKK